VRRPTITALVVITGLLLLIDLLVVNDALGDAAGVVVDAAILVAAGAALAVVASLAVRRGGDLWRRRGDPVAAVLVLSGIAAMLVAGLRPGASGASDPAVAWLIGALLVPLGATLFGLLFISTLGAGRRAVGQRGHEPKVMVGAAMIAIVLLLPLAGSVGAWLSEASGWALAGPIGAVFRGLLIGIAVAAAIMAARAMLGIGAADE
jgi:hypothetical protein